MEQAELQNLRNILDAPREQVLQGIRAYNYDADVAGRFGGEAPDFNVMGLESQTQAVFVANQLATINGETTEELQKQLEAATEALYLRGVLTAEVQEALNLLAQELDITETINEAVEEAEALESKRLEKINQEIESRITANDHYRETLATGQQELILLQAQLEFGQDSLEYLREKHEIERNELVIAAHIAGLTHAQTMELLDQLRAQQDIEETLKVAENYWEILIGSANSVLSIMETIAGVDISEGIWNAADAANALVARLQNALGAMGQIAGAVGRIGMNTVGVNAQNEALRAGASPEEARVAGENAQFRTSLENSGMPDWLVNGGSWLHDRANQTNLSAETENQGLVDAWNEAHKDSSGGGGGGSEDTPEEIRKKIQEVLDGIALEIEQKERLLGLNEEQRNLVEHMIDIENQLGEHRDKVSQETIQAMAEEQIAIEELLEKQEEAEQRRKQLIDTLESDWESAVMSVIEGTASVGDAFRDMLRQMILDVYKNVVLESYTKYASGFFSGLFGFSASGGDIQGPTVVGERGRELFIPKAAGTIIPNHDLERMGGGDTVTVVQHFNISANGDESVKRIIRQETPRIAEQAKMAVLDAKNRGGSFAKAF